MASRFETPFQISLDHEQARHLTVNGQPRNREQLRVTLRGDSLEAQWPANDTFDHPPQFVGKVEQRPDGLEVTGTIREAWSGMMMARIWRIPTFAMIACAILGAVLLVTNGVHYGLAPLLIGIFGTAAFWLVWRWQTRLRRPVFDSDARKLSTGLTQYLTTGDGSRPVRW